MTNYPALTNALKILIDNSAIIPEDLLFSLRSVGIKTEAYYERVLSRAVRDLYNGGTEDDFLNTITRLLDEQIVRAWNEGMRLNDLDPQRDMKPEWEDEIKRIQDSEFNYVQGFIDAILQARQEGTPIQPLLDRAGLWSARYSDVVSRAQVITAPKDLNFRWVYGDTVDHCETCAAMTAAGVQSAQYWADKQAEGIYPQSQQLACHGFFCSCVLESTDDKVTTG